jgi:aryl-phospho-beta-D-glucosidase BglC (GH1 family)
VTFSESDAMLFRHVSAACAFWRRRLAPPNRKARRPAPNRAPRLELLEERVTPTTVTFGVDNAWNTGYQAHITITNDTTAPINNWVLTFNYAAQITSIWNGSLVSSGAGQDTIDNAGYNSTIAPNTSVTIGILGTGSPTPAPTNYALNGVPVGGSTPALPALSIGNAQVTENGSNTTASFAVTLSAAPTQTVTVAYATADGTAQAGVAYTAASGTLTFAPGQLTQSIPVTVLGSAHLAANETFTVTLSNPSGATLTQATGTGTLVVPGSAAGPDFFHTSGNQVVDAYGNDVRIASVALFGLEQGIYSVDGMGPAASGGFPSFTGRSLMSMLEQIQQLGFNTIRLPFSNQLLDDNGVPTTINYALNPEFVGLTGVGVLEQVVADAGKVGLRVILDDHHTTINGPNSTGLWYAGSPDPNWATDTTFVSDWVALAKIFAGNPTVIGADLFNEPEGDATWGDGNAATDWRLAAEVTGDAIQQYSPHWLIIVEGIQSTSAGADWWGGNLSEAGAYPVQLTIPDQVVYSPHDYSTDVSPQSWFSDPSYPNNLPAVWTQFWGYLYTDDIAPVWLGEFGTSFANQPSDTEWISALTSYLNDPNGMTLAPGQQGISWSYWAFVPDSGDVGGILENDWQTANPAKMAYLTPMEFTFPTVDVNAPGSVGFTTAAQTFDAGADSGVITLLVKSEGGNPLAGENINLSSSSATGKFYASATSTTPITSVTTNANGQASFVYEDPAGGSPVLTATDAAHPAVTASQTEGVLSPGLAVEVPGQGVSFETASGGLTTLGGGDASALATDPRGDIVAEVPGLGVEQYTPGGGWAVLTPAFASALAMDGRGDAFAEFPGLGVWEHAAAGGWARLTPVDALALAADASGDLAGVFPSAVYLYHAAASAWAPLAAPPVAGATAALVGVDAAGDVFAAFAAAGLWEEPASGAAWKQLSANNASAMAVDSAGDVTAEFPAASSPGVYRLPAGASSWAQLSTSNAARLTTDAAGDVDAVFQGGGVQQYTPATGSFAPLSTSAASLIAESGGGATDAGDDLVSAGPSGVSRYDGAAGAFTPLNASAATLAATDANGDVAALIGGAVWRYRDATGWVELPALAAAATQLGVDAAGDVFAAVPGTGATAGVLEYTDAAGGWQQLSAGVPSLLAVGPGGAVADEVPGQGVALHTAAGWVRLTQTDASALAVDAAGDVAAEFPGLGVFRHTASGWAELTGSDASAVAVDGAGDVAAEFPGLGLYRYQGGAWQQLSANDASLFVVGLGGAVTAQFADNSLLRYPAGGATAQLAPADQTLPSAGAAVLAADANGGASAADALAEDVQGAGVYRYEDATGWVRLNTSDASLLAADADGDVAALIGSAVWLYRDSTGWVQLPAVAAAATQLGVDAAGDVFAAVPGAGSHAGVLEYTAAAGWQQLTASVPALLAVNASGQVAAQFAGLGVFQHTASGWAQLTGSNASAVALDGRGDVAAAFAGLGVFQHTASGWAQLALPAALAGIPPTLLAGTANGSVAGEFPAQGVWLDAAGAAWAALPLPGPAAGQDAAALVADGAGDLVVEVKGHGAFRYRNGAWTSLANPAGDPDVLA